MPKRRTKADLQAELEQAQKRVVNLEAALDEQRNRDVFSSVFHASPAQMALTSRVTGKYVEVNEAFLRVLGFARDEVLGKTALELNLFVDPAQRADLLQRMSTQGFLRDEDVQVRAKSGDVRHGIFSAEYLEIDGEPVLLTVMNDITEHLMAEKHAAASETQIKNLLNATPDAMLVIKETGQVVLANAQAEVLFGYTQEELLNTYVETLIPERFRNNHTGNRKGFLGAPRSLTTGVNNEIFALRKDGVEIPVEVSLSHYTLVEGDVLVLCSIRDITERKHTEAIISAQRDLAKLISLEVSKEEAWAACFKLAALVSGLDSGGLYIFNKQSHILELMYHEGLGGEFVKQVEYFPKDSPNAQWVSSGKSFYFSHADISAYPFYQKEGLRSLIVIPIQYRGRSVGCLNIASHTLTEISERAQTALGILAAEIGNVIIHFETESDLRESHRQLRRTLLAAQMGSWRYDIQSNQVMWSPEAAQILGASLLPEELGVVLNYFHPQDRAAVAQALQDALAQRTPLNVEYRILRTATEQLWVTVYGQLEFDSNGQAVAVSGLVQDITPRKRMEHLLEVESMRRRILFEEAPDGVLVIDPKTAGFVEFNTKAHVQLGYTREEFAKLHIYDVEVNETAEDVHSHIAEVLKNGRADFETLQRTKQGEIRNIHVSAQVTKLFDEQIYFCIWRDVTERRRAEEARRESDDRYHLLFQNMVQGVVFQNGAGEIVQANPAAERILGLTTEQMMGRSSMDPRWHSIYEDGSIFPGSEHPAMQALRTGQPVRNVSMGVFNPYEGSYRWLNINAVPRFLGDEEKPYQVFTTFEDVTENKKAQAAMLEKIKLQEQLEKTASIAPGLMHIFKKNLDGHYSMPYSSEMIRNIYGVQPADVAEDAALIFERIDPRDIPNVQATIDESERTMQPWRAAYRYHHPQKGLRWVEGQSTPVRDVDGSLLWYGLIEDITERKLAEENLRESEEKYRNLLNGMNDTVWVIGFDARLLDVNNAAIQKLGYSREELLSMMVTDIDKSVSPEQIKVLLKNMPQDKTQVFETFHQTKAGLVLPVEISSTLVTYGGETAVMSIARDISERKRAEEALYLAEKRSRYMIENAPDGIVLLSLDGKFKYVSPSVTRIFGYASEDILLADPNEMTHPEDLPKVLEELQALIQDPLRVPTLQYRFKHKNGEWRWIESTFSNLLALPTVEAIIINFRDIHERKVAEEELRKSQALLTEAQRIGRIGHMEWNGRERALICSDELYDIFDVPQGTAITQELIGHIMLPGESERIRKLDHQFISQRTDMDYEYAIQTRDGRVRWLHQVGKLTYAEDGTPLRMMSIIQDVTERKQAEEIQRADRSRLEMALRGANAGMWDWNIKTGVTIFNERWAEMVGYTLAELEPISIQTWIDLCHPDDLKISNDVLQKHFAGEIEYYEFEARMKHKNGSWIWVIDRGKVFEWDEECQPVRMFGTHLDITDRKHNEQATQAILRLTTLSYETSNVEDLMRAMLDEAEVLTNSNIGFFHFVDDDQNTISLQAWSTNTLKNLCTAEGKGMHYAVQNAGVWANAIRLAEPCIYNDYATLSTKRGLPQGHAPILRLISLPIKRNNIVVAALGVGNKLSEYTEYDLSLLTRMAEAVFDIIMRKRVEEALRQNEERFRTVADFTYDMEYWLDEHKKLLYISPSCMRITGFTREHFLKDPALLFEIIHPEDRDAFLKHHQEEFKAFDSYSLDFRIVTAEGLVRWVNHTCQSVRGEDGQPHGRRVSHRDITERQKANEELRTSEAKYRQLSAELEERVRQQTAEVQDLYDNAPTGYYSLNVHGNFVAINQTALNWLGYTSEEVLGRSFADFVTDQSYARFLSTFQTLKEGTSILNTECEMRRKNGSTFSALLNSVAILDEQGNYIRSRSTIFDNTERKQAELAVRESEATYRALFENSNDGIFLMAPSGEELRANQHALDMVGYTLEEYLTMGHVHQNPFTTDLLHREDADDKLAAVLRGEQVPLYERVFTAKDGKKVPVEINLSPVRNEAGTIFMVQSVVRNISQRKAAEEALRLSRDELSMAYAALQKASHAKDEFLANMSHELRTPLNGILGMAEILLDEIRGPLNERQRGMVSVVESSGRHLLSLINDILDLSKIEAGKLELNIERISVADVCATSLIFIKEPALKKGIKVEHQADPQAAAIFADARRLKQILINLLSNAIKFTQSGGKVTLQVQVNAQRQSIDFSVIDTGIGISTQDQLKLFRSFTQVDSSLTRQHEGTGLGLALVKQLVELHGGGIEVKSEVGRGSTFTVSFPYNNPTEESRIKMETDSISHPNSTQASSSQPPLKQTILLAEDIETNVIVIGDYLESQGYEVIVAVNGREAIEKAQQYSPNLILMDIQMPEMDGLEATRRLRADARFTALPIVALTAMAMTGDRELCLEAGATDYISKPVSLKQLGELIKRLLKEKH